jgi:flagellar FliJ protein
MFRFRLERVLQHRQREVDSRSREVATAHADLQQAEATVADALGQLQRYGAEVAARRQGSLDATSLQRNTAWQGELVTRRSAAEVLAAESRRRLATVQEHLQQAWRDREVLERLRQRQRQEWEQEEARRERRALDEIGAIRSALARRKHGPRTSTSMPGGD